jgi:hypothetical protein
VLKIAIMLFCLFHYGTQEKSLGIVNVCRKNNEQGGEATKKRMK